jgi:hypothetical protein
MFDGTGNIVEIQSDGGVWISCLEKYIPSPGQYLAAWNPAEPYDPLPTVLFPGGKTWRSEHYADGQNKDVMVQVRFAPPFPSHWQIGSKLRLFGPLGQGFRPPKQVRRLGLVCLSSDVNRLLPLVQPALDEEAAVALFSDAPLPQLPLAVEAYPLSAVVEFLEWPDYLAFDLPVNRLPELRQVLGLAADRRLTVPAQVLVTLPMPCVGMGDCGACAVEGRHSNFLTCKDGPVFDLERLNY